MPPQKRRSRGYIEELPSGSFRAEVFAGIDPLTGKKRKLRETCKTHAEAKKALTKLQRQVDENKQPKSSITVGQAVAQWLEVADLQPTTQERYDDLIRLYVLPTFGHLQAGKLDAELLERFYARLQRCRTLCTGRPRPGHECRPLSASTTRKVHYILRAALDRAVRWRHLGVNPAAIAQAPAPSKAEPDPPSADEAAAILNEAWRDPEWGLLLWLTMLIGPRRGEISALRWHDVDLDRATVWVQRSNTQSKAGVVEKSTKTDRKRRVALDPHTVELLRTQRDLWISRLAALGVEFEAEGFVFSPSPDGRTPYAPRAISQRYRRLAVRLKLRSTRLHSLRHYSATELVAAGVDIRTVAGRLGHGSGGATTLRVYAAWVEEADRRAAATIATVLPQPKPAVRRSGPYELLAAALRQQIQDGSLPPGALLPTMAELAVANSCAVGTAHRAVSLLREEGLVEVSRGRRAVVIGPRRIHTTVR
ncbi:MULTISPECIES: tyrosine-type recombinase/integrase [Pseudonocardia]|jgi:integrase|uniref:Tyrosine-type recombinase/integrase n=3 Tax=Pseudonocardia TaxID=1847 RepID=A0ABP4I928_9PSEU|nr:MULTISPECIES: tyrosine-type recombinase/integrase [Pseudonocardia]OJG04408.1 putative prophage phiRv2 integrase [Pseudonocardia autotrophica]OSY35685.1 putative prophage phiRv2 integrase [Pseudonocardia autotrophica]TDN75705.1 site-specific recombinase XerC [Pseudonocardia autotrophica]BBF99674.1 site-specific integrase [Pseudonocardia autotrophica]GEC28807.1 site-specific integrase [Pseudonocardia saturnea]